jgi:hypothetical protein
MAVIRHITNQFNPVYLKPATVARAMRELVPNAYQAASQDPQRRHRDDRRCGVDRRQSKRGVLVDMRSVYSRRVRSGRRDREGSPIGIDVYA